MRAHLPNNQGSGALFYFVFSFLKIQSYIARNSTVALKLNTMNIQHQPLLKNQPYINGKWITTDQSFPVTNPFDGSTIASVTDCGQTEIDQAIEAANNAFTVWSNFTASKRSRILKNWYNLQLKHAKDLATILTTEQGKPITEAIGEVKYGASFVEWFAEEAKRVYGDVLPGHSKDKRITVIKQPIGVVGAITPWNFPNAMITRKVAPALAAGCTVVIKPSELTPLSALALAQLADEAGFPPGVLNILTVSNPEAVGKAFTQNRKVKKLSFTGSTRVGKLLLGQAAGQVKKVSLELGGNAPFIVFDDADVELAVEGCIGTKFRNAGQTCICSNRIFVQESVYDQFVRRLTEKAEALTLGNGLDDTHLGPLINEAAVQKCERLLADAQAKGAQISANGGRENGLLFKPTLITEASREMAVFEEEIFGPLAAVYRFQTEEEVIALANDTDYGLASYFYGRDYARIWRVAESLEYGMVGINTGMISTTFAPFGGVKESGIGREGSKYGIEDYLNIKYMCWGGI